jgi:hypothetical protein
MPHHVLNNVSSNVISFPSFGKAITLDDQGIYYAVNARTGSIYSVFQLVYQNDWYLYQLESTGDEDDMCWSLLTENLDHALCSMPTEEIRHHFSKPEYAEPRGAWQVIKNSKFGFGKFTPLQANEPIRYAMLVFASNEMLSPILIHKAEEDVSHGSESLVSSENQVRSTSLVSSENFANSDSYANSASLARLKLVN